MDVADRIDPAAVTELALALGCIDSPSGAEHAVSDFLFDWCAEAGLLPRRVRADPSLAANIVARIPGAGRGPSLLFNSHMDTAVQRDDPTFFRDPNRREYHTAWQDAGHLFGIGVVNDKGPMAAWLVAMAAIRRSGVELSGDLVLTMVTGEIGHEPAIDTDDGIRQGKDYGSRYVATHGAVADFALVAETTGFVPIWVEPGKAFFRVAVNGRDRGIYTPYLARPYEAPAHPNAIVRAAHLVPFIEEWALEYEERHRRLVDGGEVVPKVNIGAISGGDPSQPILTPASCALYVDVRIVPGENPMAAQRELRSVVERAGIDAEVECYLFRRGYEATGADTLVHELRAATNIELQSSVPDRTAHTASSMWRDVNVWNELGVPAVTFGPGVGTGGGNVSMSEKDLVAASRIYARVAAAICSDG